MNPILRVRSVGLWTDEQGLLGSQ